MPHTLEVDVPYRGRVRLIGGNGRIAVEHVKDGVGGAGQGWYLDSEVDCPGGGIVAFSFVRQRESSGGIRGEDDVVAVGVGDIAAVPCGRQIVLLCY
jgi:hypothetical protein